MGREPADHLGKRGEERTTSLDFELWRFRHGDWIGRNISEFVSLKLRFDRLSLIRVVTKPGTWSLGHAKQL